MEDVSRAFEKGETEGFMKILVDADTKEILGASFLGTSGDEAIHCVLDLMYANLTAADSATKSYDLQPGVGLNVAARVSVDYETLTLQFGGAYQVVKVGPDRGAEGPTMAGVGQTAFDVLAGGRYYLQEAGPSQGTFLNDRPVQGRVPLTSGDQIRIGRSLLRFFERQKRSA